MPNSTREPRPSFEAVRAYLRDAIPHAPLTRGQTDPDHQPLLILQTDHTVAAFAFASSDIHQSYNALYKSFKRVYAEQASKWESQDLNFVLCVDPASPNLDSFRSSVETDVYFCRKFVIPVAQPLDEALARLPFLPLLPIRGQPLRPPSAQTLLQQSEVPTTLAKYIVVQRERSPEGIVEDCLRGAFGEPRILHPADQAPVSDEDHPLSPVALGSVTIKNFRAYRKQQTFAIAAGLTVLYGPNGFGKTSFFDAIDFAFTGDIGRLKLADEEQLKKAARHLDSKAEEGLVSLVLRHDGAAHNLSRTVSNSKRGLLDGRPAERKTILAELTGGTTAGTDRVENFVSLFRATHLFSQEHQELARDFDNDCELSGQVVSRMLAFEDYANATKKTSQVLQLLESSITTAGIEAGQLSTEIENERREADRLREAVRGLSDPGALSADLDALRSRVAEEGIPTDGEEVTAEIIRGWRAALQARASESQLQASRLSHLAREAGGLPQARKDIERLQERASREDEALRALEEKRTQAESALVSASLRLAEITAKRSEKLEYATLLTRAAEAKPAYARSLERSAMTAQELSNARADLELRRASAQEAEAALRGLQGPAQQALSELTRMRDNLSALQSLGSASQTWQSNRQLLAALRAQENDLLQALQTSRDNERRRSSQMAALNAEEAILSRKIAEADRDRSELTNLISRLQAHIDTSTCPLCGHDHRSRDILIKRIQEHAEVDQASGARARLNEVTISASQTRDQTAEESAKTNAIENQIDSLAREQKDITRQIARFEESAESLGITPDSGELGLLEHLESESTNLRNQIGELETRARQLEQDRAAAEKALDHANQLTTIASATVAEKLNELSRLQEEADRLRADPRMAHLIADLGPEQLAQIGRETSEALSTLDTEAAETEAEMSRKKIQARLLQDESATLKSQLSALRTQLSNLQKATTDTLARLEEAKQPPDAGEDVLLAQAAEETKRQIRLIALRDLSASLEMALDAATTAALMTRFSADLQAKEQAKAKNALQRKRYESWLRYFGQVSSTLTTHQSEAIANFTRHYGPRTSVIQRRLRSVYGFDDIEVQSHGQTITVRAKRHGEELRPTDYFSQSQRQTLLLSLFLTACLSQTWSALAPIFMDDPVTHFDDLNAYAFLDLIAGLLGSEPARRQFIISTCDEKLLQLARRKFRHLGGDAKFYRFTAIGDDGPAVEEIREDHEL